MGYGHRRMGGLNRFLSSLARGIDAVCDFCWPPTCLVCGEILTTKESLSCNSCLGSIRAHQHVCKWCGSSLAAHVDGISEKPGGREAGVCSDCRQALPPFAGARCYGPHLPPLSILLYHLKYRHRPDLARSLGALMTDVYLKQSWWEIDAIVAVPTTRWRMWRRGYNQAVLLARDVSQRTGIPLIGAGLFRRSGRSQVGFAGQQRAQNVQGVFGCRDHRPFMHRTLMLIDDVYTTGATAKEVSQVLLAAGARRIYVLTLTSTGRRKRSFRSEDSQMPSC